MTFRIGEKVVCVDASRCYRKIKTDLVKNKIYTIEAVEEFCGDIGLTVAGARSWFTGGAYNSRRFRPIVERKTDISFAHEILRKASKPAKMPASVTSAHHRQIGE